MATSSHLNKRSLSDESSLEHSTKKSCSETISVFSQLDILMKYHIIWVNEQQTNPLEYYTINSKFRRGVIDYLECFANIDKCRDYIQSLTNDRSYIIMIVSVFNTTTLLQLTELFTIFEAVNSIYIHENTVNGDMDLIKNHEKIKSVDKDMTKLFSLVSREAITIGRENFVAKSSASSTSSSDVTERTACVKLGSNNDYFFNFLDTLTETEANANGKEVFVEECRRLFVNKQSILRIVDEFDQTYIPNRAIYWYTRNGFLYTLVNQALRQQNIEALLLLHFFIRDLDLQLLAASEQVENINWEQLDNLYRGQRMSIDEIEDLKVSYQQGFFQSFLSTTKNIEVARMFSGSGAIEKDEPVQPVLFHFNCSSLKLSRGVANIQDHSDNEDEEEILFSPLYSFSVRQVEYDDDEHVWKVECSVDGDETNLSLLLHQRLIKLDLAVRILMSSTSSSSSDNNSNEEMCQIFTNGISILLDELVIPEGNIVTMDETAQIQGNTKHAVTALFLLKGLKSFNRNSLAHKPTISADTFAALWDCLTTMCKEKGEFQRALDYYEKAQTYHIENMPTIIARKINIAQVYRMMGQYAQTWSIYRELLDECFDGPDKDNFDIFTHIATDLPYIESERAMEIWYPNVFNYLEYIYVHCQERSIDMALFRSALMERYRALGHAYWYLVHNKEQTLICYDRWKDLLEEDDQSFGEFFMYLAHVYCTDDPIRAKSLYEQAIVELSMVEETWSTELAICYSRLGYLQRRKRFFLRCFYLLTYVTDLATLRRKYLEETGECYLYIAKYYVEQNSMLDKEIAYQYCQQALRLFLNVKPPTSNFREMQQSIELLLTLQEATESVQANRKHELLQKAYDEAPITEQQLKQILEETLRSLHGRNISSELIMEEIDDENFE